MRKYKILDHPADLRIQAFGDDLPEVFVNMALGMASQQIKNIEEQKAGVQYEKIAVKSDSLHSLLIDWLNEILYLGEINKKVYLSFKILNFSASKIEAEICGIPVEEKLIEIKAATYHDLEIKKAGDHWEAIIVFDI